MSDITFMIETAISNMELKYSRGTLSKCVQESNVRKIMETLEEVGVIKHFWDESKLPGVEICTTFITIDKAQIEKKHPKLKLIQGGVE